MSRTTVLIPIHRDNGNREWLQQAISSFDPGTPYLVLENDGDVAEAFNAGLAAVETEFLMMFGADDVATPGLIDFLEDMAWDADVVYPSMRLTDENMTVPVGDFPAEVFCGNRLLDWNFVTAGSLARTSKVREVGGWRTLESFEDWDLWVRMHRAGARFKAAPEAFFYYRQVEGSRNSIGSAVRTKDEWREVIVGERPPMKATFYYQATPATSYWRCVLPARHLPGIATSELIGRGLENGHVEFEGQHGPAAVFQFAGSKDRAWSAINLQAQGVKVLVEVDDNYLDDTDPVTRGRAGWAVRIGEKVGGTSVQGHRWIVEQADGVIVTTPKLAEIYADVNENVFVCRNSLDMADWPTAPEPFEVGGVTVSPDDDVFRVGWFASMSHDRDEGLVRRALSWASRQPGVQVVTMGYNPPWGFDRLHIPWSNDIAVYHRMMHLLDVGLCPVERTGWAVCRSDLKALEYSAAGALPVMSGQPPYDEWRNKPFGRFAGNARQFEEQVRWAVANRDQVKELAAQAKAYVMAERTIEREIKSWEKAVAC